MKRFTWSLTLVICLAFWPAISLVYVREDNPKSSQTVDVESSPDSQLNAEEPEQKEEDKNE